MHFSILTLSLLSFGQLIAAARIPDITIKIDIDTHDDQAVRRPPGRLMRHGGLQQSIQGSWAGLATHPTCAKVDKIRLDCGKGIKSTDQCPTYCSCKDGKLHCPETEDCSAESIDYMCGDYAKCACSAASVASGPTCGKVDNIILECGKGIESTDQCPTYCSCKDGKLHCPETEDCSTESIDYMCGDYAKCACSAASVASGPTCAKVDKIRLDCGKGIKSTDQCPTYCSCKDGKLHCPETEDCSAESIDYMCGDYAKCACSADSGN